MKISIYCKVDRYGEVKVVNEDGLVEEIQKVADDLKESDCDCLDVLEDAGFSFRELLEASDNMLVNIREKMEEGFMARAKEHLFEYDWKEFEVEVSEKDLRNMLKSLPVDELTKLFTSVMREN